MTNYEKLKKNNPGMLADIDKWMSANWNLANTSVEEQVNKATPEDLLDIWLMWNGIRGYTNSIIKLLKTLYDLDKEEKKQTYIVSLSAEDDSEGFIDLTEAEYQAVKKATNPENWRDATLGSWSGSFSIVEA